MSYHPVLAAKMHSSVWHICKLNILKMILIINTREAKVALLIYPFVFSINQPWFLVRVKGNSGVCPSSHSTRGRKTAWRGHQSITGYAAQTEGKEKTPQVWGERTNPRARTGIKACLNNINPVLPWCNSANYRGSHVDISDILTWDNSTHFIWKYWINATDCIFNETSFRTFPSCSVCKLGCPQSVRDRLCLISITTAAAQTLKTRKLGLNIFKLLKRDQECNLFLILLHLYSSLIFCFSTPFAPVCPLAHYREFCWVWHVWNQGAKKGQCSEKANTR